MHDIEKLRARLKEARDAYFNLSPIMSDQEYDALLDQLRKESPEDFEVTTVGASPPKMSVWEKVEHKIPMGSLSKVNSKEEFEEWVKDRLGETGLKSFKFTDPEENLFQMNPLLFTLKVDGSSMELVYEGGRLARCVTRGDGKVGEDVSVNIRRAEGVLAQLPNSWDATVRGEIVMLKKVFQEHYSGEYANPRNTAAGKVRDTKAKDEDCRNLLFLAYDLVSPLPAVTESQKFSLLESMGFRTPENGTGSMGEAATYHEALAAGRREEIPYEIDGTVMRVNNLKRQEELGDHNMRPRGQVAFKFDPLLGTTEVLDVRWQVGPTGRITPVASLAPVEVGGVTITSISMHNLSMFRKLALFRGCRVLVSRRNDVIPYIEQRLD